MLDGFTDDDLLQESLEAETDIAREFLQPLDFRKSTHKKFIKFFKEIPRPSKDLDYDYMQLHRLIPKSKLKELEEASVFTSHYTKSIKSKITGEVQRLLMLIYWDEGESEQDKLPEKE